MKRVLILAAAVLIPSLTASASVFPIATNIAAAVNGGTASTSTGASVYLNDQSGLSQTDITPSGTGKTWAAVTFGSIKTFNHIIIEQTTNYVVAAYDIQLAGVANPNPDLDSDWISTPILASYSGQTGSSPSTINLSGNFTTAGIRVKAIDASNSPPNGIFRTKEIYAFSNYSNLALTANSISAPGWTGTGGMKDQQTTNQEYTTNLSGSPDITFNWLTPQYIGAIQVHGGAGAGGEYLTAYQIQYWNGTSFITAATLSSNPSGAKTTYHLLANPIETTQLRLHITGANDGGNSARVAEIFIFQPLPEPSTMLSGISAGLLLLRRRRR